MTDLLIKTGRVQFIILGFILTGFILFGRQFVLLWAGPDYSVSWVVALVVMAPLTVPLFQNIGISILQAKNMHAFRSVMYLGIAAANVLVSIFFAKSFGAVGAALGISISLIAGNIVIINWYYHFRVGLNIPRFFKELGQGLVPAMFISAGGGALTLFIPGDAWGGLVIRGIIFALVYVLAMFACGMNEYEKALITGPLSRAVLFIRGKLGSARI